MRLRARPHVPPPSLADVVAGLTVALVLIPQSLAYAELAGVPAHHGLYAAAIPAVAAALFASSPYLQNGPTAMVALLTFGALASMVAPRTPEFVAAATLLALVVGLVRLALGLLSAGVVAYLISAPMLMGFTTAAGLVIAASQFPALLGIESTGQSIMRSAIAALAHPASWDLTALALTAVTFILVSTSRKIHHRIPGALLAVLAGIGFTFILGYDGPKVGLFSAPLPLFSLRLPWLSLPSLLLPGAVIALVGFAEVASIARTLAALERRYWDPNRELVSQGIANLASGVAGGFPVGGSFSRSTLNRLAGAQTAWSGAVSGLAVLAVLPLTPVLQHLPKSVLAAIVIGAILNSLRFRDLMRLWSLSRAQFVVAWATFLLTVVLVPHVEQAIMLGVLLAVGVHLWRELPLRMDAWREETTLHLRPRGVLWFGSAPRMEEAFLAFLAQHPDARTIMLHLGGLGRVDLTGALVLKDLLANAQGAGLEVRFQDVPPHSLRVLDRVLQWKSGAGDQFTVLGGTSSTPARHASR